MQYFTRFTYAALLTFLPAMAVLAKPVATTTAKEAEYKRTDANFYFRTSVLKAEPDAVILSASQLRQKDDSYFFTPHHKAPKKVYVEQVHDWLEPITPPSMPASLGIAPDAMQIREPQGDVQVALPSSPTSFVPATDSMAIPNGSVVKTGDGGTAAVLFGGVNSVRLTPQSEAAVQQTVTPQLRTTEIDLKSGAAFSKVGLRPGEKQDYRVKSPFGVAAARGTDFVTVVMPDRTDVWIAQGTVQLDQPNGQMVGTVKSDGKGALKIVRFPVIDDAHKAMAASAETMTMAMNFIPLANVKTKALHDQMAQGTKLSPQEKTYVGLIKKVPVLIELALVEPPAPPPAPTPAPAPTPPPTPAAPDQSAPAQSPPPATMPSPQAQPSLGPIAPPTDLRPASHAKAAATKTKTETASTSNSSTPSKKTRKTKTASSPPKPSENPAPVSTGPNDTVP